MNANKTLWAWNPNLWTEYQISYEWVFASTAKDTISKLLRVSERIQFLNYCVSKRIKWIKRIVV